MFSFPLIHPRSRSLSQLTWQQQLLRPNDPKVGFKQDYEGPSGYCISIRILMWNPPILLPERYCFVQTTDEWIILTIQGSFKQDLGSGNYMQCAHAIETGHKWNQIGWEIPGIMFCWSYKVYLDLVGNLSPTPGWSPGVVVFDHIQL
jgi:hypothetical protein